MKIFFHKKPLILCLMLLTLSMACRGEKEPNCENLLLEDIKETFPVFISESAETGTAIRVTDGMTMLFISSGSFKMGLEDGNDDERPVHSIYLDEYWIDQTEVSNAQYQKCVQAGACTPPYYDESFFAKLFFKGNSERVRDEYFNNPDLNQHPVVWVRWKQAQTYCQWAGGRLPTEAEWEKAARGSDGREYPWGDAFYGDRVNYCDKNGECKIPDEAWDDGYQETAPVGSYPQGASPYGVLDMAGNVSEWVADWFDYDYYQESPQENPFGPACADKRLVRGGCYDYSAANVRSTLRDEVNSEWHFSTVGFRCAADMAERTSEDGNIIPEDMSDILPDGASVNGVWAAADGSAWIYGSHGIMRVDAQGIAQSIYDEPVEALAGEDASGRIWAIGQEQEFIAAFAGGVWKTYSARQGWQGSEEDLYLSPGLGDGLTQDDQGRLWLASGADALWQYEPAADAWRGLKAQELGFPPLDTDDYQGYFLTDSVLSTSGQVWVSACLGQGEALLPAGVARSLDGKWEIMTDTSADCVLDMERGGQGEVWAGGSDALLRFDPGTQEWKRIALPDFERPQIVSDIHINPLSGMPWIEVLRFGGASPLGSLAYYHWEDSAWIEDLETEAYAPYDLTFAADGTAWWCGEGRVLKGIGENLKEMVQMNLLDCHITFDGKGNLWIVNRGSKALWHTSPSD